MKLYLHLADSGVTIEDLRARLYDDEAKLVSAAGLTLAPLALLSSDYTLDGLPDAEGLTLTTEYPDGVFSAYQVGTSRTQPSHWIIPVREVFDDPADSLGIAVFGSDEPFTPITVEQVAEDGEYLVSGWPTPTPRGRVWRVRWTYSGQVFAASWVGTGPTGLARNLEISAAAGSAQPAIDAMARSAYGVTVSAFEEAS